VFRADAVRGVKEVRCGREAVGNGCPGGVTSRLSSWAA
jgi:hypothetical protein